MQKLIDLKQHPDFVSQYVALRNRHTAKLVTDTVTEEDTRSWLRCAQVEVRCLVDDNLVLGAVVLYLGRDGEIAIFVRDGGKGTGSVLLRVIEETARNNGLERIWAWVMIKNTRAQRLFLKNAYLLEEHTARIYNNKIRQGLVFGKHLT